MSGVRYSAMRDLWQRRLKIRRDCGGFVDSAVAAVLFTIVTVADEVEGARAMYLAGKCFGEIPEREVEDLLSPPRR